MFVRKCINFICLQFDRKHSQGVTRSGVCAILSRPISSEHSVQSVIPEKNKHCMFRIISGIAHSIRELIAGNTSEKSGYIYHQRRGIFMLNHISGCLWQVPLVRGRSGEPDVMAQLVGTTAQRTLIDNNLRK